MEPDHSAVYFARLFRRALEIREKGDAAPLKAALLELNTKIPPSDEYGDEFDLLFTQLLTLAVRIRDEAMLRQLLAIVPAEKTSLLSEVALLAAQDDWKEGYDLLRPSRDRNGELPVIGILLYQAWRMDDPSAYVHDGTAHHRKQEVKAFWDEAIKVTTGSRDNIIDFLERVYAETGQYLLGDIPYALDYDDEFGPKNKQIKSCRPCSAKGCDLEAVFKQIEVRDNKHYSVFKCRRGHETLEEKKKD